jgi:hypothetical protein
MHFARAAKQCDTLEGQCGARRHAADGRRQREAPEVPTERKHTVLCPPWCHGIPWAVPDNIANKHVIAFSRSNRSTDCIVRSSN